MITQWKKNNMLLIKEETFNSIVITARCLEPGFEDCYIIEEWGGPEDSEYVSSTLVDGMVEKAEKRLANVVQVRKLEQLPVRLDVSYEYLVGDSGLRYLEKDTDLLVDHDLIKADEECAIFNSENIDTVFYRRDIYGWYLFCKTPIIPMEGKSETECIEEAAERLDKAIVEFKAKSKICW